MCWDTTTGTAQAHPMQSSEEVDACAVSLDGRIVVSGSVDRSLKVWNTATGALTRTLTQHTESVHALAVRAGSGFYCASGSEDRTVRIWQPQIGRMVRIVRGHGGSNLSLASPSS